MIKAMRPVLATVSSVLLLASLAHPAGATTTAAEGVPDNASEPILVQGTSDEYVDTDFPWKAYVDEDNEVHVLYGPGAPAAEVDGQVLDGRDGSDEFYRKLAALPSASTKAAQPQGVSAMAAPRWVCENYQPSPTRSGSQLKAYVGMTCTGAGVPSGRLAWQFERHGVSLTGWVKYSSDTHYTTYKAGGTQGTYVYARCNTTDGRSRSYTTYARSQFVGLGWVSNWGRSRVLEKTGCGYKEL